MPWRVAGGRPRAPAVPMASAAELWSSVLRSASGTRRRGAATRQAHTVVGLAPRQPKSGDASGTGGMMHCRLTASCQASGALPRASTGRARKAGLHTPSETPGKGSVADKVQGRKRIAGIIVVVLHACRQAAAGGWPCEARSSRRTPPLYPHRWPLVRGVCVGARPKGSYGRCRLS
jgi:hypothetical protein